VLARARYCDACSSSLHRYTASFNVPSEETPALEVKVIILR
jgi:hypothetical protein